jgi:hypothetical protein
MLRVILSLLFVVAVTARAQKLPYTTVLALQETAESFTETNGVECQLRMIHSRAGDTRDFKVFLEAPSGKTEIKVSGDGSFHLPFIPESERDRAHLTSTLERGALTFSLYWEFKAAAFVPSGRTEDMTVFQLCSAMLDRFRRVKGGREKLRLFGLEFADDDTAVVGIKFPRAEPRVGKALLKRGQETVASVDFSQRGKVFWGFEKYNPREHRIVLDLKKGDDRFPFEMAFANGEDARRTTNAIFLWLVEPTGAADRSQPSRSDTDRVSGAAGSRR